MSSFQPQSNIGIRLSLSGQAQTIAGLRATALAQKELNAQAVASGQIAERSAGQQWLMNQALFTARRLAYGATLAFGAATVGVVAFGLKFNSSMEQNMVAFTAFLGSASAADAYLDRLYQLAAHTPFTFAGLTEATKKLIAMGYSADQAYRTMADIGDAAAGLGLGQDAIDRMTLAFGQMRTNGRILGGELRQLSEVGINARRYLQEAFNLTPDQMANIGALHIPAAAGIEAILRGIENDPNLAGMAERQGRTFMGRLSTIYDEAQKLFGTMTKPLFDSLEQRGLPAVEKLITSMESGFAAGGWQGMIAAMDENFGAGGRLILVWGRLASIGNSLWIIWNEELWPALQNLARVASVFLLILWPLSYVLKVLTIQTDAWVVVFKLLVLWMVFGRVATYLLGLSFSRTGRMIQMFRNWIQLTVYAIKSWVVWTFAYNREANGQFLAGYKNNGMLARLSRSVLLYARNVRTAAMVQQAAGRSMAVSWIIALGPIFWIIAGIVALIAIFTLLYFKWDFFHDLVNTTFNFIRDHWKLLAAILIGPFLAAGIIIYAFVTRIWTAIQWVADKAMALWHRVQDLVPFHLLGGGDDQNKILQNAITPGRPAVDPRSISRIGNVVPNTFDSGATNSAVNPKYIQTNVKIDVDGRPLAEAVARHKMTKDATR